MKLGIFISAEKSSWKSCNFISPNLIRSYEKMLKETGVPVEWLKICYKTQERDLRMGSGYLMELATKIYASGITDLVFLDHHVDPQAILVALRTMNARLFRKFRFTIHIYGDFTLAPGRWNEVGKMLEGTKTKYICASDRQRRMIAYFENEGESVSSVVPFPVNTEIFKFSATSRAQVRKRLGISSDKKLLLYTGRLSLQKCIIRLLEEFHQLVREGNHDLCLALAGPYDDLGGMTSNIRIPVSYYFHQVQEKLRSLPKKIQEKIFFLGDLEVKDLTQIYSAADLFVSISLHHDEDYGMCPGEALSSGLPCILTDWGGYPGFQKGGLPVELIPVALGKRGLEIDSNILKQLLRAGIQNLSTPAQRKKTGAVFAKNFGIHAVAEQLKASFCDEEFKATGKFRWTLEVVARNGSLTGDLYKEVYGQYVHQSAN